MTEKDLERLVRTSLADVDVDASGEGAKNAIEELATEVRSQKAVLRELEWAGTSSIYGESCCPSCLETPEQGHLQDCRLAAAIR